jgi:hypothetical protein
MTTWILAYPDQEASRLEKVVLSMPIDADGETVDGKPERLPKVRTDHRFCRKNSHAIDSKSHAIFYQVGKILRRKELLEMPSRTSWTTWKFIRSESLQSLFPRHHLRDDLLHQRSQIHAQ